jgi:hypothetical protein
MRSIALIQRSPAFSLQEAGRARLQIAHSGSDGADRGRDSRTDAGSRGHRDELPLPRRRIREKRRNWPTLGPFGRLAEAAIQNGQRRGSLAFMATHHGFGRRRAIFLGRDPTAGRRSGGALFGGGEQVIIEAAFVAALFGTVGIAPAHWRPRMPRCTGAASLTLQVGVRVPCQRKDASLTLQVGVRVPCQRKDTSLTLRVGVGAGVRHSAMARAFQFSGPLRMRRAVGSAAATEPSRCMPSRFGVLERDS